MTWLQQICQWSPIKQLQHTDDQLLAVLLNNFQYRLIKLSKKNHV